MTRDKMNEIMQHRTLGGMRRIERRRRLEWDGCWPIVRHSGRGWYVSAVYDSDDIERVQHDLVPVEIVGAGASLRLRRCDAEQCADAYVHRHDAVRCLPIGGGA